MPDRVIRDEILDSDRYIDLSSDSVRLLFLHFLLIADDLGNCEATYGLIRRRLLPQTNVDQAEVEKMLTELAHVDLIRRYAVDGKSYAHIPRFRQRLRSYKRTKPRPPSEIECNEIKEVIANLSDTGPSSDRHMSDTCPSPAVEEKGREGKRREEKRSASATSPKPVDNSMTKPIGDKSPEIPHTHTNGSSPKIAKTADWWSTDRGIERKAKELGITANKGETYPQFKARIFDEIKLRRVSRE
jgi:hypothetical protein